MMQRKKAELLSQALSLHRAGQVSDAETLYRKLLEADKRDTQVLNLLGIAALQRGAQEEGVRWLMKSLGINPLQADVCCHVGNALRELKRFEEALASCDKALSLKPGDAMACQYRSLTLQEMGRIDEALAGFNRLIEITPGDATAYFNRGIILQQLQRHGEALSSYDKAIELAPDNAVAMNNRGTVLQELGRYQEALASYDKAIAAAPGYADAYGNHANILRTLRRYDDALTSCDAAIRLARSNAHFHYNRGLILQEMRRQGEALASYDKAIALAPDDPDAYDNRAIILQELKRYDEAVQDISRVLLLKPGAPYLEGVLLHLKMQLCDWEGLDAMCIDLAKKMEAGRPALLPFHTLSLPLSMMQQQKCAELYVKDKCPPSVIGLWNGETYAHERIRIAYVSADFREHPLSYLMAGVFEKHDKARFETYGIALEAGDGSATGQRVTAAFDHFIDVSGQSDKDVGHLLHDAEIDIAIDLMGFTLHCRPNIFARRVAPVQVNYLGYPATMRADYMDYIIGDGFVIPPQSRQHYSEKVVYLPDCFQANDDKRFVSTAAPPRSAYGLPEDGFVFCSLNNSYKIIPPVFEVWMRLLKAVPGSVLWLLGKETVEAHLRSEAADRGIDPSRLVFAGMVKYHEHLARLRCADLFLDTLPFNAGTTASDVLWAGVPLLTCAGAVFAARMAGSLLTSLGLSELITENLADYEALAVALATQPQRLSAVKANLAQCRGTSPLFNTERFTRHLEQAYIAMWEKCQAGGPPEDIVVHA